MTVSDDTKFQRRFEYHCQLVSRRWQYFAALLLLNSLMLSSVREIQDWGESVQIAIVLSAITSVCVFIRLAGRSRIRIRENASALNSLAGEKMLEIGDSGTFNLKGISIWLYIAMISMTIPWFAMLYKTSEYICLAAFTFFSVFLLTMVPWKHGPIQNEIQQF